MEVYRAKAWICPNCGKNKTAFKVERIPEGDDTFNLFEFKCDRCRNTWGFVSTRYNDMSVHDLINTFKMKWEMACNMAKRGNHDSLNEFSGNPYDRMERWKKILKLRREADESAGTGDGEE